MKRPHLRYRRGVLCKYVQHRHGHWNLSLRPGSGHAVDATKKECTTGSRVGIAVLRLQATGDRRDDRVRVLLALNVTKHSNALGCRSSNARILVREIGLHKCTRNKGAHSAVCMRVCLYECWCST